MRVILLMAALAAIIGGCSSPTALAPAGVHWENAGVLDDAQQKAAIERALTDKDIALLLDAKIAAKLPTGLAVAKLSTGGYGSASMETLSSDELQGWEKTVEGHKLITGVHPVSPLAYSDSRVTLHSLRTSAALMGCELLLVYLQADSSVDNSNPASALYWTFVGLWLAPGNTYERQTVMQAIVVDCRTGTILGTATGDCRLRRDYIAAYRDVTVEQVNGETPAKALADVQKESTRMIDDLIRASTESQHTASANQ